VTTGCAGEGIRAGGQSFDSWMTFDVGSGLKSKATEDMRQRCWGNTHARIHDSHLRYPNSRSRSSRLFNLDFAFSVFVCCSSPAMESRTTCCSSHIRIQVFSYHVADHLSLANKSLLQMHSLLANILNQDHRILCVCLIHGYRFSIRYLVTLPLSLSTSFNREYTFWSFILLSYRSHHSIAVALQSLRRCRQPQVYVASIHVSTKSLIHVDPIASVKNPHHCHLSLSSYPLASLISSCRCLSSSLSLSASTSQITASKPSRSSPLERVYCHELCALHQQHRRLYPVDCSFRH
jgi:hypothetical protein